MAELNEFIEEIEKEQKALEEAPKQKPEMHIYQPDVDQQGKKKFVEVGAIWRNTSKAGRTFYSIKIGNLRLIAFPA
ncbi:MAG: hypothetical protein ACP5IG_01875 [Candidatus Micrarchaeia archaeon]